MANHEDNEPSVDDFRKDLTHQLKTADDMDWDYFVETALRAQQEASRTGVNMNEWRSQEYG